MSEEIPFQPVVCTSSSNPRFTALQRAEILRSVEFFSKATVEELFLLAAISCEVRLEAGKEIFKEGEIADALYIIVEGKVELAGSTFKDVLGPHDAVGLYAVLADEPRYASAKVLEDAYALKIGAQDFYDLLSHNTEIVQSLFKLLTSRLASDKGSSQ
jgi:CRP-like cAMP-binding protein